MECAAINAFNSRGGIFIWAGCRMPAQASYGVGSLGCGRTGPSHRSLAASSPHKCKATVYDLPFIPLGSAAA